MAKVSDVARDLYNRSKNAQTKYQKKFTSKDAGKMMQSLANRKSAVQEAPKGGVYRNTVMGRDVAERKTNPSAQKAFDEKSKRNNQERIRNAFYDNGDFSGGQKEAQRHKQMSQTQRRMAEYEKSRRKNLGK